MEEKRTTRRAPLIVALAGTLLLAAMWATMALAGGSTPAVKPVNAKAAPAQSAKAHGTNAGKSGREKCPFKEGTSNNL